MNFYLCLMNTIFLMLILISLIIRNKNNFSKNKMNIIALVVVSICAIIEVVITILYGINS